MPILVSNNIISQK